MPAADVEVVDLGQLVEEPVIPCTLKDPPCGQRATMLVVCRFCRGDEGACEDCYRGLRNYLALCPPTMTFQCAKCGAASYVWDAVWRVVPMGGA